MSGVVVALVLAASALDAAAEPPRKMTNPIYASWAEFEEGSSVTYRSVTDAGAGRPRETVTYTLVERTKESVVVERVVVQTVDGREVKNPPQRLENARTFTLPPGVDPKTFGRPQGLLETGEDVVVAAGREFRGKREKAKGRVEAGEVITETWSSDDIPGGLIRSESRVPAIGSTTTVELIELKLPEKD